VGLPAGQATKTEGEVAQLSTQAPLSHSRPAAQALPHAPQFAGSDTRLVQAGVAPEGLPAQVATVVQ
jgi:hypothetical protein